MNNRQLHLLAQQDPVLQRYFKGVFASDELVHFQCETPCCFIANVEPSQLPGSHWTAFYLPHNAPLEYFCSYGLPPTPFVSFLHGSGYECYTANVDRLQTLGSSVCGQYCLFYLHERSRGHSMSDILHVFDEDTLHNDSWVNDWVKTHFQVDLDVFDSDFLGKQISRALGQSR